MTKQELRRCRRCVWNNYFKCGRLFCVLPRCEMKGEVKVSYGAKEEKKEQARGG